MCDWLLIYSFLISEVTASNPLHWVKDVIDCEHCGSIWINPDIDGNYGLNNNALTASDHFHDS